MMSFIAFLAVFSALFAFFDRNWGDNNKNKKYLFSGFAFIIICGSSILNCNLAVGDQNAKNRSDTLLAKTHLKVDSLKDLLQVRSDSIITLQDQLQANTDVIIDLQNKLITKSDLLGKEQMETQNTQTGGNSFPEVEFITPNNSTCKVMVVNNGKYPLYALSISIIDVENVKLINQIPTDQYYRSFFLNSINGSLTEIVGTYNYNYPNLSGDKTFTIQMSARNGTFVEVLKLRFKNNKYLRAYRVKDLFGKKIFKTFLDPEFLNIGENVDTLFSNKKQK